MPDNPFRIEMEVVINRAYGGFSVCAEIVQLLIENRGWKVTNDWEEFSKSSDVTLLYDGGHNSFSHNYRLDMQLRTHKDFIDCVRTLKEQYKNDDRTQRQLRRGIHDLKIVKAYAELGVEDYNDGHERVTWNTSYD